jgi:tRNA modification GTPase
MAALRSLVCPQSSDLLDKALCIWFPGPRSFTGEDCVELHVHGSKAVISGVFESLQHLDNPKEGVSIRPADRGEFTRRAFDNGKMDLTEVEGLADLLEADTSEQRKQALRQMNGNLRIQFEAWRGQLMKFLAHTEAVIDFGDDDREDDINDDAMWSLIPQVKELRSQLEVHLRDGRKGEIVREGVSVALVGPPNAGKSSLLNALAKRPAAIVSPIAGTTRDIVEVRLDLGGLPCIVSDTAGLREQTEDIIEKEGIKRAKNAFRSSQVKVFVRDASDPSSGDAVSTMLQDLLDPSTEESENLDEDEEDEFEYNQRNSKVILVTNKIDALETSIDPPSEVEDIANTLSGKDIAHLRISCETGEGISDLEGSIARAIRSLVESSDDESVLITRERHRRHLQQCVRHLDAFISGQSTANRRAS